MASASDDFNRAGPAIGANWTRPGASGFDISASTVAIPQSIGSDCLAYYNATTFTDNQRVGVVFGGTSASGVGVGNGLAARYSGGNYYRLVGCASGYELGVENGGSFTSITSGSGTTFTAADLMELELVGSSLKMYKNGVQFGGNQTNSVLASGANAGLFYSSAGTSSDTVNSWAAADVASSTARRMMLLGVG
jgi:hypothetical protein